MAIKVKGAYDLIGGGAGALDALNGNTLNDKDIAVVVTSTASYFYTLDAASGAAENSPLIIAPDANPGTKRWILVMVKCADPTDAEGVGDRAYNDARYDALYLQDLIDDVTPQLGGPLEMNEKTILVDAVLAGDHTWTGPTQIITAGENLAIFEIAYLKGDGKYWLTDADAIATSKGKIVMATAAIAADASGLVLLPSSLSFIRDDSTDKWTVTSAGDEMYLSLAVGELTNDLAGHAISDIIRIAGYMETAVILCFDADKTYVEKT